MSTVYTATLKQASGSGAYAVEFRHPTRPDPSNQGKPGRKVRKGLGKNRAEAEEVTEQLNRLLADTSLHTPVAKARAEALFDPRFVELFYEGIDRKSVV